MNKELETIIRERIFPKDHESLWKDIRTEIPTLIHTIITEFYEKPITTTIKDPLDSNHTETLESFSNRLTEHLTKVFPDNPPFTIVRLSEILYSPRKHYHTAEKFLRALENVIQVSSSIAEFPETTFEVNGHNSLKNHEFGENTLPISIGNDETDTIFLTKIPWLTEDDIKEIESEHYLIEEYPINDAPLNEEYDHDEQPLDGEQKKRTLEESKESPEKKHKPSEDSVEEEVHAGKETEKDKNEEEERAEAKQQKDEDERDTEKKEDESDSPKDKKDLEEPTKAEPDVSLIEADETLDEDKMDINTTLEEDKMDLD